MKSMHSKSNFFFEFLLGKKLVKYMSLKLLLETLKWNEKCYISFIYVQTLQFYVLKKFFHLHAIF